MNHTKTKTDLIWEIAEEIEGGATEEDFDRLTDMSLEELKKLYNDLTSNYQEQI